MLVYYVPDAHVLQCVQTVRNFKWVRDVFEDVSTANKIGRILAMNGGVSLTDDSQAGIILLAVFLSRVVGRVKAYSVIVSQSLQLPQEISLAASNLDDVLVIEFITLCESLSQGL